MNPSRPPLPRRITNPDALAGKTLAGPPVVVDDDVIVLRLAGGQWAAFEIRRRPMPAEPDLEWSVDVDAWLREQLGLEA